ncbi:MAG: hypothetical protein WAN05_00085, partial [Roseiarcus sp.]
MLAAQPAREKAFANGKPNVFYVANNSATSPTTALRRQQQRYVANNTASTYGIPAHLQRYILVDYCKKKLPGSIRIAGRRERLLLRNLFRRVVRD